jgi:hypothetical protein
MVWPIELTGVNGSRVSYSKDGTKEALSGYAFGKVGLNWKSPRGLPPDSDLGALPSTGERYRWGYRSFDCVKSSPSSISIEDIVVTAVLDTGVRSKAVLGLDAIRPDLNETLAHIPVTTTFWQMSAEDLGERPPVSNSVSWWVWRAWALLMGLDNVDRAVTHKLLHRKRPWLFPMLDSVTSDHLGGPRAWATIHQDLKRHELEFVELEDWFATLASALDGIRLTRLRIHDVLLWGDLSGDRQIMQDLGRQFLDSM